MLFQDPRLVVCVLALLCACAGKYLTESSDPSLVCSHLTTLLLYDVYAVIYGVETADTLCRTHHARWHDACVQLQ